MSRRLLSLFRPKLELSRPRPTVTKTSSILDFTHCLGRVETWTYRFSSNTRPDLTTTKLPLIFIMSSDTSDDDMPLAKSNGAGEFLLCPALASDPPLDGAFEIVNSASRAENLAFFRLYYFTTYTDTQTYFS